MNNKYQKVGRNDKCPCGSEKKYKKCCLLKKEMNEQEIIKEMTDVLERQKRERGILAERGVLINYVKPITFNNPKINKPLKYWAIGNKVLTHGLEHETYHEFIIRYLSDKLGQDWFDEQSKQEDKHFIYQCFEKYEEWCKRNARKDKMVDEHTWVAQADGWASTLATLAFDVCSLENTLQLPEHLMSRLKNKGEYQGAHYEISVAALFARLGCSINFLDKEKLSNTHCEFIATHNETGVSISVEAKSRHRAGVKHMPGSTEERKLLRGDVTRLLNKALKQNPGNGPFMIFVDVNTPLTPTIPMQNKQWFKDVQNMMSKYKTPTPENPDDYTAIFFTNFSSHYLKEKDSDPNEYLTVIPLYKKYPLPSEAFGNMLVKAVANYGFIPNIVEDK